MQLGQRFEISRWLCYRLNKMCGLAVREAAYIVLKFMTIISSWKDYSPCIKGVASDSCVESYYWDQPLFRNLCCSTITVSDLERLEHNIVEILCKLERILPPSFFNSMEHLPVHLPHEARLCGPVQYRWMYAFERYFILHFHISFFIVLHNCVTLFITTL